MKGNSTGDGITIIAVLILLVAVEVSRSNWGVLTAWVKRLKERSEAEGLGDI